MNRSVVEFFSSYPTFFKLNYATGKLHPAIITGFVIIIGVIQLLVHSLQNIHTVYNFIYSFADFLITLVILLNLSAFLYNNKQVRQLMSHIDQHIYVYSDESKIMPSYEWIEQDDNMVRVFLYICGYFFFLGGAVSLAPFIQFLLNEKIEIIIYPGWTPWSTDRTVPFLCTYLIHFNFVVVCCFAFNLDCIFPLFITLEFRRQRKRLCAALLSIENRAEDSIRRNEKKSTSCSHESHAESIRRQKRNYQRMLKANIVECVKHHQMLLKTFKLFQPWWRMMFSVQLAASIANVTLSVFAFMEAVELTRMTNTMAILSGCVIGLLLNCYVGEEFSMLNVEINKIIFYEIQWYAKETDVKRLLLMFHMLVSVRPFTLYGLHIFKASYRTFSYICRKSYTCLNILRASTE